MTDRIDPPAPDNTQPANGSAVPDSSAAPAAGASSASPAEAPSSANAPSSSVPASWRDRFAPLRGRGGWLLIGVLLIGLFGWQWFELRHRVSQTQEQLARRLADGAAQLRDARTLAANAQEAMQAHAAKIAVLESRLAEIGNQQGALEGLYQELSRGRDEWLLSEVDQLVGLAQQQLQLAGNVQGAILALGNADARLARSERPQFIALRKAIGRDLQKLRSMPLVDVAGVALRLENAALAVDQMTLAFESRPQAASAVPAKESRDKTKAREVREPVSGDWTQWWQRWTTEVWLDVRNLIRVERFDRPEPALLAPQNAVFLRENLKLRLLGARLALIGRDQATFKGELRQAMSWLDKYFDARDRNVASAVEGLRPLLANDLSIEPPALSECQAALRTVKLSAERTTR